MYEAIEGSDARLTVVGLIRYQLDCTIHMYHAVRAFGFSHNNGSGKKRKSYP